MKNLYAYEEDGELKGGAVAIAKAVFENLGIEEVDGHLSDFRQLIPGLKQENSMSLQQEWQFHLTAATVSLWRT